MKLFGLTGGIGSGKSTVRAQFQELGAEVLDADATYHELIASTDGEPSPLAQRIGERFPGVLLRDGALDRKRLGAIVFEDHESRLALEALTHPEVAWEIGRRVDLLRQAGDLLALYDVPLLFERRLEQGMDGVIVVWVPQEMQVERLCARDRIASESAESRIAAQLPLEDKRRRADWVIDNSGSRDATRKQVEDLWIELSR